MPELPDVTEHFIADLTAFLAGLDAGIAKMTEAEAAVHQLEDALAGMADVAAAAADVVDAAMGKTAGSLDLAATSAGTLQESLAHTADVAAFTGRMFADANDQVSSMTRRLGNLNDRVSSTTVTLALLDIELDRKKAAFAAAGAEIAALAAALAVVNGRIDTTTATTAAAATANRVWVGGLRLTGAALHWIVMGGLEILSTALPAMVALGSAAAGMYPTFVHIFDATNNLVIASGSLRGALLNSVGPLHNLGVSFGTLRQQMAPDAYVIFGSVINDLAGHMGAFSGVAQQAGNVLANFATKLTTEINGPLGTQFTAALADGVKFMIQWGQVLGNLGHAFFDIATGMAGVGHVLLDVLDLLSRAFLALAANPLAEKLLAVAAAMSAVYRYGQLMVTIFNLIANSAIVTGIRTLVTEMVVAVAETGSLSAAFTVLRANMLLFITSPVGIAIMGLAAVMGIWWAATRNVGGAWSQTISRLESATPTLQNLTGSVNYFVRALHVAALAGSTFGMSTASQLNATEHAAMKLIGSSKSLASVFQSAPFSQEAAALTQQAQKLLNLDAALGQVHAGTGAVAAGMAAMAVQTALSDAKVQQLNQALDAYMQLVTGGTSARAAFVTSLANMGQVAATTANNLGTATGTLNLNAQQFSRALSDIGAKGASAWQNFDQVLGSTMPQMMDWFRQASTLGAATGATVSKAALDMASAMVRWAGSNATARSEVLAFVQAQGLNIRTWPQLQAAIKAQDAGQADLARKVDTTSQALANLSQMASNAANALNSQVTSAIATASLKSSGFNQALAKLQQDMQNSAGPAQIQRDIAAISNDLTIAQQRAVLTGNSLSGMAGKATTAFDQALSSAQRLQAYINSMHGKTLNIGINYAYSNTGGGPLTGGGKQPGALPSGHRYGAAPAFSITIPRPASAATALMASGGGGETHHHHYNVNVNVAGSVTAEHDLARKIVTVLGRQTGRNMTSQANLPGRPR